MVSLYAQYLKERTGKDCLETEHGFATYEVWDDGVYIEDIYVVPNMRDKKIASELADQIAETARSLGRKKLYGSVSPQANGATSSLKVLLAYGFKLLNSSPELIMFFKEI